MSTPVASRRCTVRNLTNPDSGEVESHSWRSANVADVGRRRSPRHPDEAALRIVGEVPVADATRGSLERDAEGWLVVRAGEQRERLVQRVAEAGVDVPVAVGVLVGREAADRQHEVVRQVGLRGARRSVHASDVAHDRVAERSQQLTERTVEVEAIAALAGGSRCGRPNRRGRCPTPRPGVSRASRRARARRARGAAGTARRPRAVRRRARAARGRRLAPRGRARPPARA